MATFAFPQTAAKGLPSLERISRSSSNNMSCSVAAPRARVGPVQTTARMAVDPPSPRSSKSVRSSSSRHALPGSAGFLSKDGEHLASEVSKDSGRTPWEAFVRSGSKEESGRPTSKLMYLLAENSKTAVEWKKFEKISGRIAMMTFAGVVALELTEGHGLFKCMDSGIIIGFGFVSVSAVLSAIQAAYLVYEDGVQSGGGLSTSFTMWLSDSCQSLPWYKQSRMAESEYSDMVDLSIQSVLVSVDAEPPQASRLNW